MSQNVVLRVLLYVLVDSDCEASCDFTHLANFTFAEKKL